jgi:hypothetical protein
MDVDQALVRPDLEVLLRVLVLERRLDDRVDVAVAPVRVAVSTISLAAVSRAWWS